MQDDDNVEGRVIPFPRAKAEADGTAAGPDDASEGHEYAEGLLSLKKRSTLIRRAMLALPSWVTPNGVTVGRALLVVPIIWLLRGGSYGAALGVIAIAMLLDFVDGALAQARNQKTELGAFLDPLADKVLICGSLLSLLDRLPWPFTPATGAVCTIAVLITMVRIVKMARARQGLTEAKVAAKPAGKLKLVAETASLILVVLGLAIGVSAVIWAGFAFLVVALWYALGSLKAQLIG